MTGDSPEGPCARCLLGAAVQTEMTADGETATTQDCSPAAGGAAVAATPRSRQLGPIELVRQIGKGGMGEVWLGRHDLLRRNVAVKLLTHAVMDEKGPEFTTFIAGARVAASLEHPGLNKVYHADIVHGVPYLVLELLDGPNLAELVGRSGPLELPIARAVLEAVGEAVAKLNQHDLVHRDLKPSNVVLTREGRVVVTDFGLACARPAAGSSGGVAGTPAYMAPEMFDGTVSVKTDVYALGMTAYQLLSGRVAFSGDVHELQRQHREVALDVEPLRTAGVPEGVIEVVVRATNKDTLFRSKSAWHVLGALQTAFDAAGVRSASRDERVRWLRDHAASSHPTSSTNPPAPSPSTFMEALAEMAARKRNLRATAAPGVPAPPPVSPPLQVAAEAGAAAGTMKAGLFARALAICFRLPRPGASATSTAHRAGRGRARFAFIVACAAGVGIGTPMMMYLQRLGSAPEHWVNVPVHAMPNNDLISLLPLCATTLSSVGASILVYRLLRGARGAEVGERTACGWCKHKLSGLSQPVCPECGHRIGHCGPDQEGNRPTGLQWPWRMRVFMLMIVFCFCTIALVWIVLASLPHGPGTAEHVFLPTAILVGTAVALVVYESAAEIALYVSGRSWCRACGGELKDLTEPVCPTCNAKI
jgi:serine/threonine protein kinase